MLRVGHVQHRRRAADSWPLCGRRLPWVDWLLLCRRQEALMRLLNALAKHLDLLLEAEFESLQLLAMVSLEPSRDLFRVLRPLT